MKKITSYLLIILGIIGLSLDLLSMWGVIEVELSFLKVQSRPSGLGIIFFRFAILVLIHIIGLIVGIKLYKRLVENTRLEIFPLIILVVMLISSYWLKLNLDYSLATHTLLKQY